jgi:hypothetical protein
MLDNWDWISFIVGFICGLLGLIIIHISVDN